MIPTFSTRPHFKWLHGFILFSLSNPKALKTSHLSLFASSNASPILGECFKHLAKDGEQLLPWHLFAGLN